MLWKWILLINILLDSFQNSFNCHSSSFSLPVLPPVKPLCICLQARWANDRQSGNSFSNTLPWKKSIVLNWASGFCIYFLRLLHKLPAERGGNLLSRKSCWLRTATFVPVGYTGTQHPPWQGRKPCQVLEKFRSLSLSAKQEWNGKVDT